MERAANTFRELNTDISDYILPDNMMRLAKNVRVIDLNSSSFAVTNIKGTEEKFNLRAGHLPLAVKNYNEVLYILSLNTTSNTYEIGSYPSPDYENQPVNTPAGNPSQYDEYRALNVLLDSAYSEGAWSKPLTFDNIWTYDTQDDVKIEIQPEYDGSVNLVITSPDRPPRIINSGFVKNSKDELIILEPRSGSANSNTYTLSSLDKESKLILNSAKIMGIEFDSIIGGGQLTFGNYQYLFAYQTEDFTTTDIAGESSICQVSVGNNIAEIRGGDQDEATGKQVRLTLNNLDTDFKFLKVFFRYSSGSDVEFTQYIELTRPIEITSDTLTFTHTGFEDTAEIAFEDLNQDSDVITSSNTQTQIAGYLLLGGLKGSEFDFTKYANACQTITHQILTRKIPASGSLNLEGYADPANVYNFMGYMGGETYPFGIRFIMNDGSLSPVFPVKGRDHVLNITTGDPLVEKGLIRFPQVSDVPFYDSFAQISVRYLEFAMTTFYDTYPDILDETIGFFFVRGERRPDAITSGIKVPTYRVPPSEWKNEAPGTENPRFYMNENFDESDFGNVPIVDGVFEGWKRTYTSTQTGDRYVNQPDTNSVNDGGNAGGLMPIYMLDPGDSDYIDATYTMRLYDENRWAFISGDAIVDEPAYISSLQRGKLYWRHLASFNHRGKGLIQNRFLDSDLGTPGNVGQHYDFENVHDWYTQDYDIPVYVNYVTEEAFATGSRFISKIDTWFHDSMNSANTWTRLTQGSTNLGNEVRNYDEYLNDNNDPSKSFSVKMEFASYFGLFFSDDNNAPVDISPYPEFQSGALSPIGGNKRYRPEVFSPGRRSHTLGTDYFSFDRLVRASNYGNIYPQEGPIGDINNLYTNVEGVSYKQCSPRMTYAEAGINVDVFGGDTYITKVTRRMARSGFNEADTPIDRQNIPMGILISWFQESKHNLYLRSEYQADVSESNKRSFFPLKSGGDPITYRDEYRLKETDRYSQGYSNTGGTKTGVKIDETVPFIKSDFFSRVAHSAKHVPNSFKNGYREFSGNNSQDYDVEMGRIVHLDNYRNIMHVIFEHGVGLGEINQRIQTGSDVSGGIFVQPDQVLPPTLGYLSKEIGTQNPKSVLRAPSGLYGIDREKKKIWRIQDRLEVISDQQVAAFLEDRSILDPITGYNPKYNEIVFTSSDGWTLCFHEGLQRFTSFYSFVPNLYATSGRDMYSFQGGRGYVHDSDETMQIYGNLEDCYVEFVVNPSPNIAKVFDYLNIISNEITPKKVEFFTFTEENKHLDTLVPSGTGQYSSVADEMNPLTGDNRIGFRDKKFVVQIPNSEIYNSLLDKWSQGGRMRNKYLIVRITYNTDKRLQLLNTITTFRYSAS